MTHLFKLALIAMVALGFSGCMTTGWEASPSPIPGTGYEKAGSVSVSMKIWNLLFVKTPADRRLELLTEAEQQVKEEYGDDAVVVNHRFDSRWSPNSLLLIFDLIGFVEEGWLHADVLLPIPPPEPSPGPTPDPEPEPEPEPEKIVEISFPVRPRERFTDKFGYIGVEYRTKEELADRAKARLDKRKATALEYESEYAKIPQGGLVVVNIGRQDLMHANTLWYSYTVESGTELIASKRGKEGIPNVKGRDGNWWNIVTIPLDKPILDTITIQITDSKAELTYEFSVVRLERIM